MLPLPRFVQADADMHCIIVPCLDLLALQRVAAPADDAAEAASEAPTANGVSAAASGPAPAPAQAAAAAAAQPTGAAQPSAPAAAPAAAAAAAESRSGDLPAPALRSAHVDFELLQFHADGFSERDRQQWQSRPETD